MFESLAAHLDAMASPEQKAVILEACEALVTVGVTRHDVALENELTVMDSLDQNLVFNVINNSLIPLYSQTLAEFGIMVDEDLRLPYLTDIVLGITRIENWADQQSIIDTCSADEDADAILSDLLEMVGQYHSADYHSQIKSVNPRLIDRIIESCTPRKYEELQLDPFRRDAAIKRTKLFLQAFGNQDTSEGQQAIDVWLQERIDQDGLRMGTPIASIVANYPVVPAHWDHGSISDKAESIVAIVCTSDVPDEQIITVACLYAEPHLQGASEMIAFRNAAVQIVDRYTALGADRGQA